jgi:hypothetical protein
MSKEKETKKPAHEETAKKPAARQNPEDLDVSQFLPDIIPNSEEEKKNTSLFGKDLAKHSKTAAARRYAPPHSQSASAFKLS